MHIWSTDTCGKVGQIRIGTNSHTVTNCALSSCSRYLGTVEHLLGEDGDGDFYKVSIYDIAKKKNVLPSNKSNAPILGISWSRKAKDLRMVTISHSEAIFWKPSGVVKRYSCVIGSEQKPVHFTCPAVFSEAGWCYTGSANG